MEVLNTGKTVYVKNNGLTIELKKHIEEKALHINPMEKNIALKYNG